MVRRRPGGPRALVLAVALAACGGARPIADDRAPGEERRRQLAAHLLEEPDDVRARLALAAEEELAGHPAAALEALEAAERARRPLGPGLGREDRRRLGRLLLARGLARVRRGAASSVEDLRRAARLGETVPALALRDADAAAALVELRHSDRRRRERGLQALARLAGAPGALPAWRGARASATAEELLALGRWLWASGAPLAAYEQLTRWRARPPAPALDRAHDPGHQLYLEARAWWAPSWRGDAPPPPAEELLGPRRCATIPPASAERWGCAPRDVVTGGLTSTETELDLLRTPSVPAEDARDAAAWTVMVIRGYLEGEIDDVGAELTARVAPSVVGAPERRAELPLHVRATLLRLHGDAEGAARARAQASASPPATPAGQLALTYELALATPDGGAPPRWLASAPDAPAVRRLRAVFAAPGAGDGSGGADLGRSPSAPAAQLLAAPAASAVAVAAAGAGARRERVEALREIAVAWRLDVAVARRRARDYLAGSDDAAEGWAQLGALYALLDAPQEARSAWQAAVDGSPEASFVRGLAGALIGAGDPDAAWLELVRAAAAGGEPSKVFVEGARALARAGAPLHALRAGKAGLELATPATAQAALDVARIAAAAGGRTAEVDALTRLGARPPRGEAEPGAAALALRAAADAEPASCALALAAAADEAEPSAIARLARAARWNPASVEVRAALLARAAAGDPRRWQAALELRALADGGRTEHALEAAAALWRAAR